VGTNKIGYAGVTSTVAEFWLGIKNILFKPTSLLLWLNLIGGLFGLYLISFIFQKENRKDVVFQSLKNFFMYFCFSLLLVLPNILMHAKSGMVERYLLPTTFGLAFLVVGILKNTKNVYFKMIMYAVIFFFIFSSFATARTNASIFATEGKNANILFSAVKKYSNQDSKILLVADPVDRYEVSWSIKTYLFYYGLNNFYVYPILRDYKTEFEISLKNQWLKWFEGKELKDISSNPQIIIIFDKINSDKFFIESGLVKNKYINVVGEDYPYKVFKINK
jgi:hypothetical protein